MLTAGLDHVEPSNFATTKSAGVPATTSPASKLSVAAALPNATPLFAMVQERSTYLVWLSPGPAGGAPEGGAPGVAVVGVSVPPALTPENANSMPVYLVGSPNAINLCVEEVPTPTSRLPTTWPEVWLMSPAAPITTLFAPVVMLPLVKVSVWLTVMSALLRVTPAPFMVRLSKVVAWRMDRGTEPLNTTSRPFGTNLPVRFQSPPMLKMAAGLPSHDRSSSPPPETLPAMLTGRGVHSPKCTPGSMVRLPEAEKPLVGHSPSVPRYQ